MTTRPLVKFRALCQNLLDAGVKPTATVLAKYGYAYPRTASGGATLKSGYYAAARAEVLKRNGYRLKPNKGMGVWAK